jgi:twitching motility protein PilI
MAENLYTFREEPFKLLQIMEQRCRATDQDGSTGSERREWVGVAFRVGNETFMTSRSDVREVLTVLPTTRVPGANNWIRGLANLRSQLMPVIELAKFLGVSEHSSTGLERMLVINHDKIPAALIVDEVLGFRRFVDSELSKGTTAETKLNVGPFVLGTCQRAGNTWSVLGLRKLIESTPFMQASAHG